MSKCCVKVIVQIQRGSHVKDRYQFYVRQSKSALRDIDQHVTKQYSPGSKHYRFYKYVDSRKQRADDIEWTAEATPQYLLEYALNNLSKDYLDESTFDLRPKK